ncbi:DUF883 family protein [Zoogloea sp.]|jgi:ElaB/YqjD/DUF883 family membrane-anchored ribosome-binding protein|uniref:DUF883 family protein n=1 Tax=Zoogloea sp. TaxID=49181 RepID=UPI0035B3245E
MSPRLQASRLQSDLEQILAELKAAPEDQLPALRERLETALEAARDNGHDLLDSLRSTARRLAGHAAENLRHGCGSTSDYVRNNPWRAAAVVGAAGVLLAALLSRR